MKQWSITVSEVTKQPELISSDGKRDNPTLAFMQEGIKFTVEFYNRSDYFAARDSGIEVDCIVVSEKRTKRIACKAIHLKVL